jgi:allene oxide cyclase
MSNPDSQRKEDIVSQSLAYTAAGMALSIGMALAPGQTIAAEMEQLTFVERAVSDTVTDIGAKGDSVGDILTFNNEIYDSANATKVGTDNGWCIRTVVGKAWECFWTLSVDKGQITVEGPYLDSKDSVLAVTGGTGGYAGARGEMALHARNDKGTEYDFKYSLLK